MRGNAKATEARRAPLPHAPAKDSPNVTGDFLQLPCMVTSYVREIARAMGCNPNVLCLLPLVGESLLTAPSIARILW